MRAVQMKLISKRLRSYAGEVARTGEGSPVYLLDIDSIEAAAEQLLKAWKSHFPRLCLAYSYKTNSLSVITRRLAGIGAGAEVSSGAEMCFALQDGFNPSKVFLGGAAKQKSELLRALELGAIIKLDSVDEMITVRELAVSSGLFARCLIRMATFHGGAWSRFGLHPEEYPIALGMSRPGEVELVGLHFHPGSNLQDPDTHAKVTTMYVPILQDFLLRAKGRSMVLSVGGGFPANSFDCKKVPPEADEFAQAIKLALAKNQVDPNSIDLVVEPGRCLVEDHGVLIASVVASKVRDNRKILIIDCGSNLVRSALSWFHPVEFLANYSKGKEHIYDIYGSQCFESDLIAKGVSGPATVRRGDLVLIGEVGGYDLATANFWTHPLPAVYAISHDEIVLARRSQLVSEMRLE
jgi:diaminopimelate decarboxylase